MTVQEKAFDMEKGKFDIRKLQKSTKQEVGCKTKKEKPESIPLSGFFQQGMRESNSETNNYRGLENPLFIRFPSV